ncbi:MAG: hypothetical protein DMG48_01570 [Acidobacteria bacterium]|nr:MAG: hypothetical protein DMG48_01570 [Acidobacteriota bacterium]
MVTSRSVPQQTAQIFSPLAGQKRAGLRLSQIGQDTEYPLPSRIIAGYAAPPQKTKALNDGSRPDEIEMEAAPEHRE